MKNQPPPLESVTADDFRQIREIFESALTYPAADRAPFVERACGGDARLIGEVSRMLAADSESYPLLDRDGHSEQVLRAGEVFAGHYEILGSLGPRRHGRGLSWPRYEVESRRRAQDSSLGIHP